MSDYSREVLEVPGDGELSFPYDDRSLMMVLAKGVYGNWSQLSHKERQDALVRARAECHGIPDLPEGTDHDIENNRRLRAYMFVENVVINGKEVTRIPHNHIPEGFINSSDIIIQGEDGWIEIEGGKMKTIVPNERWVALNPDAFSVDNSKIIDIAYEGEKVYIDPTTGEISLVASDFNGDTETQLHHLIPKNFINAIRNELIGEGLGFGSKEFVEEFILRTRNEIPCIELARDLAVNWDMVTNCLPIGDRSHDFLHESPSAKASGYEWNPDRALNARLLASHLVTLNSALERFTLNKEYSDADNRLTITSQIERITKSFIVEHPEIYIDEVKKRIHDGHLSIRDGFMILNSMATYEQLVDILLIGEGITYENVGNEYLLRCIKRKLQHIDAEFDALAEFMEAGSIEFPETEEEVEEFLHFFTDSMLGYYRERHERYNGLYAD